MPSARNAPDPQTVRLFAAAAGLQLSGDRLERFTAAFVHNTQQMRAIVDLDYGRTEPAVRFSAPPSR
jgi:hypothetical protein